MTKRDFNTNFLKPPFYNWCICLLIGLALATSHVPFAQTNAKLIPKTAKKWNNHYHLCYLHS